MKIRRNGEKCKMQYMFQLLLYFRRVHGGWSEVRAICGYDQTRYRENFLKPGFHAVI